MCITSEEEVEYEKEYQYEQKYLSEEDSFEEEKKFSAPFKNKNSNKQKEDDSSYPNESKQIVLYFDYIKLALEALNNWISFDFTGSYTDESSDNFNSVVWLLRDKTINLERQKKWEALFSGNIL